MGLGSWGAGNLIFGINVEIHPQRPIFRLAYQRNKYIIAIYTHIGMITRGSPKVAHIYGNRPSTSFAQAHPAAAHRGGAKPESCVYHQNHNRSPSSGLPSGKPLGNATTGQAEPKRLMHHRPSSTQFCRTNRPKPRSHRRGTRTPERYVCGMGMACAWQRGMTYASHVRRGGSVASPCGSSKSPHAAELPARTPAA